MKLINYRYSLDLASNSEYIESITLNDVLVEKKSQATIWRIGIRNRMNLDTPARNVIATA